MLTWHSWRSRLMLLAHAGITDITCTRILLKKESCVSLSSVSRDSYLLCSGGYCYTFAHWLWLFTNTGPGTSLIICVQLPLRFLSSLIIVSFLKKVTKILIMISAALHHHISSLNEIQQSRDWTSAHWLTQATRAHSWSRRHSCDAVSVCRLCVWSSQNHIFNIPHSLSSLSRQLGIVKLSCDSNTHKSWSDWIFLPKHIFHIKTKYWYCAHNTRTHTRLCQSQSVTSNKKYLRT